MVYVGAAVTVHRLLLERWTCSFGRMALQRESFEDVLILLYQDQGPSIAMLPQKLACYSILKGRQIRDTSMCIRLDRAV